MSYKSDILLYSVHWHIKFHVHTTDTKFYSKVVEGSWESIAGCVVHVDVRGECVRCEWMQCNCC